MDIFHPKAATKDWFINTVCHLLSARATTVEKILRDAIEKSLQPLHQHEHAFGGPAEKERYLFLYKYLSWIEVAVRKSLGDAAADTERTIQLRQSMEHLDDGGIRQELKQCSKRDIFIHILKEELRKNSGEFEAFLVEYARLWHVLGEMGTSDQFQELLDSLKRKDEPAESKDPTESKAAPEKTFTSIYVKNCEARKERPRIIDVYNVADAVWKFILESPDKKSLLSSLDTKRMCVAVLPATISGLPPGFYDAVGEADGDNVRLYLSTPETDKYRVAVITQIAKKANAIPWIAYHSSVTIWRFILEWLEAIASGGWEKYEHDYPYGS